MIALLQRVSRASVTVENEIIGRIGSGLLVFVAFEREDTEARSQRMLQRLLGYRVFSDNQGKMNLSLIDVDGGLLLVPQFTLAANTKKGMRPSFSSAVSPDVSEQLFNRLLEHACQTCSNVQSGRFGANMQVELINDGPVTFRLQV